MNTSTSRRTAAPQNNKNARNGSKLPFIIVAIIVIAVAVFAAVAINYANQNKYNWDNLKLENGRMVYYEKGDVASTTGIDVSDLQGSIDWEAVKNDGIDFAMLRCGRRGSTEGQLYTDTKYYENVEGATRAGLPHGVYFFSQATNEQEALEEAEYVLNLINGAGVTYPVVYDQRPRQQPFRRAAYQERADVLQAHRRSRLHAYGVRQSVRPFASEHRPGERRRMVCRIHRQPPHQQLSRFRDVAVLTYRQGERHQHQR